VDAHRAGFSGRGRADAFACFETKMPLIYAGQGVHYAKSGPSSGKSPSCSGPRSARAWREERLLRITRLARAGRPRMPRRWRTHVRDSDGLRRRRELGSASPSHMAHEGKDFIHPPWMRDLGQGCSVPVSDSRRSSHAAMLHRRSRAAEGQAARSPKRSPRASRRRMGPGSRSGCPISRATRSRCRPTGFSMT
jgi:hypothetical protein